MGDIESRECWAAYFLGWKHGARGAERDPILTAHDKQHLRWAYDDGFIAGKFDRERAMQYATRLYGCPPGVIRESSKP